MFSLRGHRSKTTDALLCGIALLTVMLFASACASSQSTFRGMRVVRVESTSAAQVDLDGQRLGAAPSSVALHYSGVRTTTQNPALVVLGVASLFLAPASVITGAVLQSFGNDFGNAFSSPENRSNSNTGFWVGAVLGIAFAAIGGLCLYYSSDTVEYIDSGPFALGIQQPTEAGRHTLSIDLRGATTAALGSIDRIIFDAKGNTWRVEHAGKKIKLETSWQATPTSPTMPTSRPAPRKPSKPSALTPLQTFR